MLGKLFNLGTGTATGSSSSAQPASQHPVSSLESVQEDLHTRSLLFPDAQSLLQHHHDLAYPLLGGWAPPTSSAIASAFDYDTSVELETRDIRVLIMQDALGSTAASLLYDSQGPPPTPVPSAVRPSSTAGGAPRSQAQELRRNPTALPRKPSLGHGQRPVVVQPESPHSKPGAFEGRSFAHGRHHSFVENESQRAWREYREELASFSSCMFGNSELMAYKGTSTKVHVLPSDPRSSDSASASAVGDGRGSVGRSHLRASRLSRSLASESPSPFDAPPPGPGASPRLAERRKVLITRLFPVTLPADDDPPSTPQFRTFDDHPAYPFPMAGDDAKPKKKPPPRQRRTPMYAIALVLSLPSGASHAVPAVRSAFRGPGSYTEPDSFPSSFGSARRAGWSVIGPSAAGGYGYGPDFLESAAAGSDGDDHMDAVTQHWDIIMRTLTHLQSVVSSTLFALLRQVDLASESLSGPPPAPTPSHVARAPSFSGRRSEDGSSVKLLPKSNAKHITLLPHCLMENRRVAVEVDKARARIVAGLRATRVVTGQNRWGIWRDEARWISRWGGDREQAFFYRLLTGFLATHTDWLLALGPASYRKRYLLQQKTKGDDDAAIPARTVIVAQDKMAARRLVFLLSAFLPAHLPLPVLRPHRPSTSTSFGALSQSPPSFVVPILKEESLRRKINRRPGPRRVSHSRHPSQQGQARAAGIPPTWAHLSMEGRRHERRASDAASIRTVDLPLPGGDVAARKSSAATVATVTTETSIPHFATSRRPDVFAHDRPGSGGSMAADDLKRLTREDSTGPYRVASAHSRQNSRWGNVISGLWNGRRRDSASSHSGDRGRPAAWSSPQEGPSPTKKTFVPGEAAPRTHGNPKAESAPVRRRSPPADRPSSSERGTDPGGPRRNAKDEHPGSGGSSTQTSRARRTPDPSGAFESPVKTSINLEDGVIDVDVPFPDYLTTLETAVSSPSSSGFLSTPGLGSALDAFEQSSRASADGEAPWNVAGWLPQYHPDFVLQAVSAQAQAPDDLVEQIKASLRAEPSPSLSLQTPLGELPSDRWVDIASAVVADAANLSITRIRYRRRVRPRPAADRGLPSLSSSANTYSSVLATPPAVPAYEMPLDDEFLTEPVATVDETLKKAVEKVVAIHAEAAQGGSAASSRSASKIRERSNSASTQSDETRPPLAGLYAAQEVPRARCKTVILSALEEVVRDVVEARDRDPSGRSGDADRGGRTASKGDESMLQEAVRLWLDNIDLGD